MATAPTSFIGDADLHGLVDGHLEAPRRAETLRRLAASPADRARVEAWQGQNDLLRNAFAGIDREPLPALLDLKAKPRLHCVPANDAPMLGPAVTPAAPQRRNHIAFTLATAAFIALGLGGAWMMLDTSDPSEDPIGGAALRGPVDATLASRSIDALAKITPVKVAPSPARAKPHGDTLPTTEIPDLRAAGFSFTGADTDLSGPVSIQFRYQDPAANRVVVTVARGAPGDTTPTAPSRIGNAYGWHTHDNAYAIAGTVRPARLRAIAVALQNDTQ